jgi:uncharacterized membrane protein
MAQSKSRSRQPRPSVVSAARPTSPQPAPHQTQAIIAQKFHHGPIPPSEELANYDRIVSGAAERIIRMAEDQAAHRRELEMRSLDADREAAQMKMAIESDSIRGPIVNERIGIVLGWTIAAACVGGAVFSAVRGYGALVVGAFLCLPVATIIRAIRSSSGKTK